MDSVENRSSLVAALFRPVDGQIEKSDYTYWLKSRKEDDWYRILHLARLVLNVAKDTSFSLENDHSFDVATGAFNCELHALALSVFMNDREVKTESQRLGAMASKALGELDQLDEQVKENLRKKPKEVKEAVSQFVTNYMEQVVSPEMAYLLQTRVLALATKMELDDDGYKVEKVDYKEIIKENEKIPNALREKLLNFSRKKIVDRSYYLVRNLIDRYEFKLLLITKRMLGIDQERRDGGFPYVSQFYRTVAYIQHLKETGTPVILAPAERGIESDRTFLSYQVVNGLFVEMEESRFRDLPDTTQFAVFEGKYDLANSALLSQLVKEEGLEEFLLATHAAVKQQYEAGCSKLTAKPDQEAEEQVQFYRQKAEEWGIKVDGIERGSFYEIVHASLETKGNLLKRGN